MTWKQVETNYFLEQGPMKHQSACLFGVVHLQLQAVGAAENQ
jgi:hypothetical protein